MSVWKKTSTQWICAPISLSFLLDTHFDPLAHVFKVAMFKEVFWIYFFVAVDILLLFLREKGLGA